jgi:hypothetical protein
MGPKILLLFSQKPTSGPSPPPDEYSLYVYTLRIYDPF